MHYLHDNSEDGNLIHHGEGAVQGVALREIVDGTPLPLSICFELLAYVADILTETDKTALYHGELSLDSVGISPTGGVFIKDYTNGRGQSSIAPEGQMAGIASDTYALGLLLISLLAGHDRFDIPKNEHAHDDAIARIILSLSWQELAEQMWLENIQDFLVDTLSFFPSERPHPLDVANVLFELLPFTNGSNLKTFAQTHKHVSAPLTNAVDSVESIAPPVSQPMEEWGAAEAIEAPVLRSVSIVPDSSQGAATGLWSRQKIADMFNGSLKPEEKARREVWQPKQFGEEQEASDAFLSQGPSSSAKSAPPPPALPSLPDLPPLLGSEEPNPIDNPDYFITSQASLSSPEAVSSSTPAATQDIPPPPSFASNSMAPPADTIPHNRAQPDQRQRTQHNQPQHNRPQHDHPETAPLKASSSAHNIAVEPPPPSLPPESSVYVSQSSPSIGVNVNLESDLPPSSPPSSKTKWLLLSGLAVTFLMCLGVAGTLYRNKDMLLSQLEGQAAQSTTDKPQANTAPTPEPEVLPEPEPPPEPEEPEEPEIEAPEAPPEPTPQPTPPPSSSNSASTTSAAQSTASTAEPQASAPSPPPIPQAPRRPSRPTPTPPPAPTPEPTPSAGPIRATITGISGRISCGDGQQMEINNSVVMEFSSQQACRVDSSDGLRGALIIQETKTYTCSSNNGAVECR